MSIFISWVVSAMVIFILAYIVPGVHISSFITALAVALVLGIINAFLKPILLLLTLPINILSLGLFTFVLNALLIIVVSNIVPGFTIDGFLWALVFAVALSIANTFVNFFPK